ncbi:MAG: monofunctional biosynthetic peptidoglycan transglycosylase [Methylovulum sp.]
MYLRKLIIFFTVSSFSMCLLLRWCPPPLSMFMLYQQVEDVVNLHTLPRSIAYRWVSRRDISAFAGSAVIAAEDQHFIAHYGFDVKAISAAFHHYQNGRSLHGASTISQQTAKNLFLIPAKSWLRKGLEAWFTCLLELLWDKPRILEMYMNIAEFGDHLYGIEAASQHYFGVSAKQLTRAQCALLAAVLPNPKTLNVAHPSAYVLSRQRWILRQMRPLP